MDAPDQVGSQGGMYGAMTRNTVFSFKFSAAQHDVKVTLTRCRCPGMACMAGTVVHYFDLAHGKRRAQLVLDFLPNSHFT